MNGRMEDLDKVFGEKDFRCEENYLHGDYDPRDEEEPLEPCLCGGCDWEERAWSYDPDFRCSLCGGEPRVETFYQATEHTARRDHADGKVKAGDRYRKIARGGYHPHGPRWMETWKVILKRAIRA